jgi:hypothetical protein
VDILIESTRNFEQDLGRLNESERAITIKRINDYAGRFPSQKASAYRKLHQIPLSSDLNGYDPSLYTLRISKELRVILAVDEDPIFGQVIFTLFRVVKKHHNFEQAYQGVAESLYQDLIHRNHEAAQVL